MTLMMSTRLFAERKLPVEDFCNLVNECLPLLAFEEIDPDPIRKLERIRSKEGSDDPGWLQSELLAFLLEELHRQNMDRLKQLMKGFEELQAEKDEMKRLLLRKEADVTEAIKVLEIATLENENNALKLEISQIKQDTTEKAYPSRCSSSRDKIRQVSARQSPVESSHCSACQTSAETIRALRNELKISISSNEALLGSVKELKQSLEQQNKLNESRTIKMETIQQFLHLLEDHVLHIDRVALRRNIEEIRLYAQSQSPNFEPSVEEIERDGSKVGSNKDELPLMSVRTHDTVIFTELHDELEQVASSVRMMERDLEEFIMRKAESAPLSNTILEPPETKKTQYFKKIWDLE